MSGGSGAAQFGVSDSGSLLYLAGSVEGRTLAWVDRQGHEEPLAAEGRGYSQVRLSPDGLRLALDVRDDDSNIRIWEFARGSLTRFTLEREVTNIYPVWTPDGRQILFSSDDHGQPNESIHRFHGDRAALTRS